MQITAFTAGLLVGCWIGACVGVFTLVLVQSGARRPTG
jgi:hypothetical protein